MSVDGSDGNYSLDVNIPNPFVIEQNGSKGTLSVTEYDQNPTAPVSVSVSDAPISITGAQNLSATVGVGWSDTVATINDSDTQETGSHLSATVAWSDGQTDNGTLVSTGNGVFTVTDARTFTTIGNMYATVTVNDSGGASNNSTASGEVNLPDLSVEGVSPSDLIEHTPFNDLFGVITSGYVNDDGWTYTATVTFQGQTFNGTVDGNGDIWVNDAGMNLNPGTDPDAVVTATVSASDVGSKTGTSSPFEVTVADAPLSITTIPVTALSGTQWSGTVASFTDTDPVSHSSGYYTATIDWGDDSQPTTGTIVSDGEGGWIVQGLHPYLDAGAYVINVFMAEGGNVQPPAAGAADVKNPIIQVDGKASEDISIYESQSQQVVVSVLDPTNNNAPLAGWVILRTDNHQNLVNDNLATNGAPPTGYRRQDHRHYHRRTAEAGVTRSKPSLRYIHGEKREFSAAEQPKYRALERHRQINSMADFG